MDFTAEGQRLKAADQQGVPWRRWGPYLSDRQWGTVREDYSENGDAWSYFTHDQARSRAYRWGEDGIAGVSDDQQHLCLSLALWNGADPILKERFFGLTNAEGNHGEDVKEYYFHLDNTPTHSYMRMLYKYPQAAYPYDDLVVTNREPLPHRVRVRAARHRGVRRGPVLRRGGGVRQGRSRGPRRGGHGHQPGAGRRAARRAAYASGSATPGRRRPAGTDLPVLAGDGPGRILADPPAARPAGAVGRRKPPSASSPTTRPMPRGCSAADNRTPYVKDGINDYVVHGRAERRQSRPHRHQGGRPPPAGGARRRLRDRPLAAAARPAPPRRGRRAGRRSRRRRRPPPRRGRRVLPGDHPARRRRRGTP